MSKKVKTETVESATTATAESIVNIVETAISSAELTHTMNTVEASIWLEHQFEKYPNASLRKLSSVLEITYGIMLKASKQPVPGQVYDAEVVNWEAVMTLIERRQKRAALAELDWDQLNEGRQRHGSTLCKDMSQFDVGTKVYLRRNNTTPYEVVYKTETHIVLMLEGTSEPMAWSHNTFLLNGPSFEPRTVVTAEET